MNLTKRSEYAIRALIRLGMDHQEGLASISVSSLGAREHLPFKFLEHLLFRLKRAGVVKRVRGKRGGTQLARPLSEIMVGEVIRVVDGDIAPTACTGSHKALPCSCPHIETCGLRMVLQEVHNATLGILDHLSLEKVLLWICNAEAVTEGSPAQGPLQITFETLAYSTAGTPPSRLVSQASLS